MKKFLLILLVLSLLTAIPASAAKQDILKFAPYTEVNLQTFVDAGYDCFYDDYDFGAEIYPAKNEITGKGEYDSYSITFDIKVLYSSGSCTLIPRMIFQRSGMYAYFDSAMRNVYIKNGENRYRVDVSGCSRSTNSKSSTATDNSVEPMYITGMIMLEDLAEYPQTVSVSFNKADSITLTAADLSLIKNFYETCKAAGIFEQDYLLSGSDDYYIRTLFNENSVEAEEDASEALESQPEEESEEQ